MSLKNSFLLVLFTTVLLAKTSEAETPPVHFENFFSLDNGKYNVSWMYNSSTDRLHFMTEVITTGWVALGLADQAPGNMIRYDLALGGVLNDGAAYFADYSTIGIQQPVLDTQQDWVLTYSREANGTTTLKFYRDRNTTDHVNDTAVLRGAPIFLVLAYSLLDVQPGLFPQITSVGLHEVILIPDIGPTPTPIPVVVSTPTPTMPVTTQLPFIGCGGMLNGSSGSFATPGYSMLYPNNLICIWTLRIPADSYLRLKFIVFHTEQCCDTVELIDSAGQVIEVLSGFRPQYTVRVDGTRTNLIRVRFDSDSSVRRIGFLAQYHIIPLPPTPTVPSTTPITALPTLSSIPIPTTLATALPTLSSIHFPTTLATELPTFSSAPFDTTDFTVQPSTPSLSPMITSSVVPPVILPPDVQRVLVDLLSSVSQIVQQLTGLLGKPITPADFESFRNETLQILRQIENQLLSPTPTQPGGRQMAKRAIPDIPDLQQLVQMLDNIQRRLLG